MMMKNELHNMKNKLEQDWVAALIRSELLTSIQNLLSEQMVAYRNGYGKYSNMYKQTANTPKYSHFLLV